MPVAEHLAQAELDGPAKQAIHPRASRQTIVDTVC